MLKNKSDFLIAPIIFITFSYFDNRYRSQSCGHLWWVYS